MRFLFRLSIVLGLACLAAMPLVPVAAWFDFLRASQSDRVLTALFAGILAAATLGTITWRGKDS